jgi:hypothetical protein
VGCTSATNSVTYTLVTSHLIICEIAFAVLYNDGYITRKQGYVSFEESYMLVLICPSR